MRHPDPRAVRALPLSLVAAAIAALSACTSAPPAASASPTALVAGEQATVRGRVVRVDTAPWAYDGNAIVTLATDSAGTVDVQLPARWNLCKAAPLYDIAALAADDRVEASGTVIEGNALVVCEQPSHHLRETK